MLFTFRISYSTTKQTLLRRSLSTQRSISARTLKLTSAGILQRLQPQAVVTPSPMMQSGYLAPCHSRMFFSSMSSVQGPFNSTTLRFKTGNKAEHVCMSTGMMSTSNLHTSSASAEVNWRREHRLPKRKKHPMLKYQRVVLIDSNGVNLGEMDSMTALGMVEGQGLEAVQVKMDQRGTDTGPCPIFKMLSRKEVFDNKKAQQKLRKKNPHDVIKELKIRPQISDHDMAVKMKGMRMFLAKGNRVKVRVGGKVRRLTPDLVKEEFRKREGVLDSVKKKLFGEALMTPLERDEHFVSGLFKSVVPIAEGVQEEEGLEEKGTDTVEERVEK